MAKGKTRDFWTDDEVELLLNVTYEYKVDKAAVNIDWETLLSKYGDIFERYWEHYPSPDEALAIGKEYPHKKDEITKGQLTAKVKAIRTRYRQAVDSGRRNGHGRVILLYFELCESIWGGSPATHELPEGIEVGNGPVENMESIASSPDTWSSSVPGGDGVTEDAVSAPVNHPTLSGYRRKKYYSGISAKTRDYFAWTDDEVELLLKVTRMYKEAKAVENLDWETLLSKYVDIFELYRKHYPSPEEATAMRKEYPHSKDEITRSQLTAKVKAIRNRYRQAVDSGRRNGHGRVILLYFELCESIWGGSPATHELPEGIEIGNVAAETIESIASSPDTWSSSVPAGDGVADDAVSAPVNHPTLSGYRRKKYYRGRSSKTRDFLVWTDDEVELLLKVTREYKEVKAVENIDWETLQSKYVDIFELYRKHYPSPEEATAMRKEYPHRKDEITRSQLTAKVKAIRNSYRQAVNSGRRNGHGRVILLYFELCESIWRGSPATHETSEGIEAASVAVETMESIASSPDTESSSVSGEEGVAEDAMSALVNRGQRLDAAPSGYRRERLKRKLSMDAVSVAQEDLDIKRQLLQRLEETHGEFMQTMGRWSSMMDRLNSNIEMLVQHIVGSGTTPNTPRYIWDVKNGEVSLVHECRCQNSPNPPS